MAPLLHLCPYPGYLPWKVEICCCWHTRGAICFQIFKNPSAGFIALNSKVLPDKSWLNAPNIWHLIQYWWVSNDKGSCQTLCSGLFSAKNIISAVLCKNQHGALQTFFHGNFSITLNFSLILKSKWRWDENFNIF